MADQKKKKKKKKKRDYRVIRPPGVQIGTESDGALRYCGLF